MREKAGNSAQTGHVSFLRHALFLRQRPPALCQQRVDKGKHFLQNRASGLRRQNITSQNMLRRILRIGDGDFAGQVFACEIFRGAKSQVDELIVARK